MVKLLRPVWFRERQFFLGTIPRAATDDQPLSICGKDLFGRGLYEWDRTMGRRLVEQLVVKPAPGFDPNSA